MVRPKGSKNGVRTPIPLTCARCGTAFGVKPSKAAVTRYCSRACAHPNKRVTLVCEGCGHPFVVPSNRTKNARFCGQACRMAYLAMRRHEAAAEARPSAEVLRSLYEDERMTTRQLAARFGVSHMSIKRWLHRDGTSVRPPGKGLVHRGLAPLSRHELNELVHVRHLSYREIGERYGVSGAAVMQWLKQHGIRRPTLWETRRRGVVPVLPTAEELHRLYVDDGLSTRAIGQGYGVSDGVIASLCRHHGIPVRQNGYCGGRRLLCVDGHTVRSSYEQRVDDWLTAHGVAHECEPHMPFDRRGRADFLANGWYIEIWGMETSARYRARRDHKLNLYRAHETPLIELDETAFATGDWEGQLAKVLTPILPQGRASC